MAAGNDWGPLAQLAGEWEGDQGLDVSYHNVEAEVGETVDLEIRVTGGRNADAPEQIAVDGLVAAVGVEDPFLSFEDVQGRAAQSAAFQG